MLYHISNEGARDLRTKADVVDLNNSTDPITKSWGKYLESIEPPEHTILEVKNKAVSSLSFTRLGISFAEEGGKLRCNEIKEYYLDTSCPPLFSYYKGYIPLVNKSGHRKYILPSHPLLKLDLNTTKQVMSVAMTTQITVDANSLMTPPVFVFEDVGKQALKANSPQAALQMAILLRNEKRYEEALFYLDSAVSEKKIN